ncbi:MAG: hypothetical protein H7249_16220, partial [Chitinophagaceae bacterium]|nr:hypothetical protein [Oligoflexus sp.]
MIRTLALPLSLIVLTACGQESTSRPTSESLSDAATASSTTKYASTEAETSGLSLLDHTKFAGTVDAKTVAYIQYDLKNLANWSDTTRPVVLTKFGAMVGLSDVNAATLGQWFMDRMTYIYPDDGQAFEFKLIVPGEKKVYPASFMGDGNHLVAGSNKGAEMFDYYQSVRRQGVEGVLLKFNGQLIPFLSPRTGVMQIGPTLFGTDDTLDETKSASHRIVKSIFRLGVLFHESRHSDGNAKAGTFGFAHVNCPSDGSVAS